MYRHVAYGLGIRSEIPLPELMVADSKEEVSIYRGSNEGTNPSAEESEDPYHVTEDEVTIRSPAGTVRVRSGREIVFAPLPQADETSVRLLILGASLAILLHQRGRLVLHASSVSVHDHGILFAGSSGDGKSTIAGAFVASGHRFLSEDITPVDFSGERPRIWPGPSQLRLWPDSAVALGHPPAALDRILPNFEKRFLDLAGHQATRPVELRRIYVLTRDLEGPIAPLAPTESLVELVRNSYVARIIQGAPERSRHMEQCARIVREIPIRRIRAHASLALLPELVRAVEEDVMYG